MGKSKAFGRRRWTGIFGEYWLLMELAKKGIAGGKLNDRESGCDIITEDNLLIEVKTSQAHITKGDKQRCASRSWSFNSIRKEVAKNPDVLVCIALKEDSFDIEHIWIMPTKEINGTSGYKNNFLIKDTNWQKINSTRPDLVDKKWIEKYENKWEYLTLKD